MRLHSLMETLRKPWLSLKVIFRYFVLRKKLQDTSFEVVTLHAQSLKPLPTKKWKDLDLILRMAKYLSQRIDGKADCKIVSLIVFSFSPLGSQLNMGARNHPLVFQAHSWVKFQDRDFSTDVPIKDFEVLHTYHRRRDI